MRLVTTILISALPLLLAIAGGCAASSKRLVTTSGPADVDQSQKLVDAGQKNTGGTAETQQQGWINIAAGSGLGAALGWFIRDIVNSLIAAKRDAQETQLLRDTIGYLYLLASKGK